VELQTQLLEISEGNDALHRKLEAISRSVESESSAANDTETNSAEHNGSSDWPQHWHPIIHGDGSYSVAQQLLREWEAIERIGGAGWATNADRMLQLPEEESSPSSTEDGQSCASSVIHRETSLSSSGSIGSCRLQAHAGKELVFTGSFMQKKDREVISTADAAAQCLGCQARFGRTVPKHHCRGCGQTLCYSCTSHRVLCTPDDREGHRKKNKRFCASCCAKIDEAQFDFLFAPLYMSGA